MGLARRMKLLGTETAFAVSAEANEYALTGAKIYPFHLGDINIPTPENIMQAAVKALKDGKTGYCSNYGVGELREVLAENINRSHGTHYTLKNIAIQPGGKPVIGKFLLTLMNPGDEVLYPNPGYPIYESLIRFYGGKAIPYGFKAGKKNFSLNIEQIKKQITQKTRLLIFNNYQNPTGAESPHDELVQIADLAKENDFFVLSDESYYDIRYEGTPESIVSLPDMEDRCLILYSFSKKYAMTGWRIGAAIGPKDIIDSIAKLNVNDESCTNNFIQYGAIEALTGDQSGAVNIIETFRKRRDRAHAILSTISGIKCFKPNSTFYLFPDVTVAMKQTGLTNYNQFRIKALHNTGVSFCTRLHFGMPLEDEDKYYIRFAYSGINVDEIEEGLTKFKRFLERLTPCNNPNR